MCEFWFLVFCESRVREVYVKGKYMCVGKMLVGKSVGVSGLAGSGERIDL